MRKALIGLLSLTLLGCSSLDFLSPAPPAYVVFFGQRTVALSSDGRAIVDQVAAVAKAHMTQMVEITGPSTKVAPGYDPSLAEPRIHAVEQALIEDGIETARLVRASTVTTLNVTNDTSGAQRVEIRLIDKPRP